MNASVCFQFQIQYYLMGKYSSVFCMSRRCTLRLITAALGTVCNAVGTLMLAAMVRVECVYYSLMYKTHTEVHTKRAVIRMFLHLKAKVTCAIPLLSDTVVALSLLQFEPHRKQPTS